MVVTGGTVAGGAAVDPVEDDVGVEAGVVDGADVDPVVTAVTVPVAVVPAAVVAAEDGSVGGASVTSVKIQINQSVI